MNSFKEKAFTLVELLIVIGIIGVLAGTLFVTINPAEAQRKARDTQRIRDLATLQVVVEAYLNDNGNLVANGGGRNTIDNKSTECDDEVNNLFGLDVCTYIKNIPHDPRNNIVTDFKTRPGNTNPTRGWYFYIATLNQYKLGTFLESESNISLVQNDGGEKGGSTSTSGRDSNGTFEIFSDGASAL